MLFFKFEISPLLAARSQAQEYKFRLEQANQKITGLEGDVSGFHLFSYYITLFPQHVVFTRFEAKSSIETMILTLTGKTCSRKGDEVLAVKPPRPPSCCESVYPPQYTPSPPH